MKFPSIIYTTILFIATCGFISCTKAESVPEPDNGPYAPAPENPNQQKLLQLVNDVRSKGCNCGSQYYPPVNAVTWNTKLEQAAKKHSEYMDRNNYLSHQGENGSDPGDRITAEGYKWQAYGENIAAGYPTEEKVMEGWLKSAGHCKNIMNGNFTEMGVATSGGFWTQVFARPQ